MGKKGMILLLVLITVCACQRQKKTIAGEEKPVIMVTIEPQRFFTEAIAGDKFDVTAIVPNGSSPETYDPTPQQLVALKNSDAYLRIGHIGFEQVWLDRLLENTPHLQVFDTSKDIDVILDTTPHDHDHSEPGHKCGVGGIEPHVWNSPENALIIARNTYRALSQLDRENERYYFSRYDSICNVITETDSIIRQQLSTPGAAETFIIYHPALSYFARDYGLQQISIENNGKEPSPAHLKELVDFCKEHNVHIIFIQPEFDKRNAKLIADEIGADIITINPLSYNWNEEMINIAKTLANNGR